MINAVMLSRAKKLMLICGFVLVIDKALEILDTEPTTIRNIHNRLKPAAVTKRHMMNVTSTDVAQPSPVVTPRVVTDAPAAAEVIVPVSAKPHGTDVLINTYMRSGSSFIGRVLGYREDTFYVYEPLHGLTRDHYFKGSNLKCSTFTDNCVPSHKVQIALQLLEQFYKCNFGHYPAASVVKEHINSKFSGPSWYSFQACRKTSKVIAKCLHELAVNVCTTKKYHTTKVLRLSVDNVEKLLETLPNLKAIHLFRDPRAIINSHMHTKWSPFKNFKDMKGNKKAEFENGAKAICDRIGFDITHGNELKKKYPDRFMMLQYEDFSEPLSKVKTLLSFFNMKLTNETLKYLDQAVLPPKNAFKTLLGDMELNITSIEADETNFTLHENITNEEDVHVGRDVLQVNKVKQSKNLSPNNKGKQSSQHKYNNGNHPFEYRKTISWECVRIINKHCAEVYKRLGYVKFNNERDLRNLSLSGIDRQLPFTLTEDGNQL